MGITDSKNTETTSLQSIGHFSSIQGDEISLTDIWNILNSQRSLIVLFAFIATLVSLITATLLPVSYRSKVVLLPPLTSDVELLNIPDFFTIKADDLYGRFLRNLQSVDLQEKFFRARNLLKELQGENQPVKNEHEVFRKVFSEQLVLEGLSVVTGDKNVFSFSLEGDDPDNIAKWLNDFVSYVDIHTVRDVISDIETKVKARTTILEKKIKSLREVAMLRRLDQVAVREEAASVASKLQIDEQVGSVYSYKHEVKGRNEELTSIKETPSYLRGSKALLVEAEVLKNRKSDDPFIPALRDVQEELFFIRKISPNGNIVHAVRVDQQAIAVHVPVKPKRKLIVAFGCLAGIIFGTAIALVKGILCKSDMCLSSRQG